MLPLTYGDGALESHRKHKTLAARKQLCLLSHALPDSSRVMPWLRQVLGNDRTGDAEDFAGNRCSLYVWGRSPRITSKTQNTRCMKATLFAISCIAWLVAGDAVAPTGARKRPHR